MNRPFIDPNEIDRIMGRQPHRLHRPYKGDGTPVSTIEAWFIFLGLFGGAVIGWALLNGAAALVESLA